jgi:FtsZ-binding cell division protein ZapB
MKEKSKAKIEAAKTLQRLIEELKKSKSYLTDEEMKAVEESLKHFQFHYRKIIYFIDTTRNNNPS